MSGGFGRVAIIGAGLVGCGWAVVYALGGATVKIYDTSSDTLQRAPERIRQTLTDMGSVGLADDIDEVIARISITGSMGEALDNVEYVQESVFERLDVKTEVAQQIGELIAPDTIVGSSSSGIPASAFTENVPNRNRFHIAHPINPPHLVPVVELVPAPWTDAEVMPTVRAKLEAIGKAPVEVTREIDGFIINRLQGALLNEAWALYEEGYASAADIDACVAKGLGYRWSFIGPFETIDLNAPGGVADYAERFASLFHGIAQSRSTPRGWSKELIERVTEERRQALPLDELPERSQWRDRRLMQLVAHLSGQPDE